MTIREERKLFTGVLLIAVALIGLAMLFAGCAPGLRKSVSVATVTLEEGAKATDKLCMQYAQTWCTTNPCPDLDRCELAYKALLEAGVAATEAGRLLNGVIR